MKILGICCSPRKGGNTEALLKTCLESAHADGAETDFFHIAGKTIQPCDGCYACKRTGECHIKDDMQELYARMFAADGIILGSPVYFWNITAQAKAIIDRTFIVSPQRNLKNKAGAGVIVQGRYGSTQAQAALNSFFLGHRMIIIGHALGSASEKGAILKEDERAVANATGLGKAMVRFLQTGKL